MSFNLKRRFEEGMRRQPPAFGSPSSGQSAFPGAENGWETFALLQIADSELDSNGYYKAYYLGWNQISSNLVAVRCITDSPVDTGRLVVATWIGTTNGASTPGDNGLRIYKGIAGPSCIIIHNATATPQVIPPFACMKVKGIIYQGHTPVFQVDIPGDVTSPSKYADEFTRGHWHIANDNRRILIDETKQLFLRDPFPCLFNDQEGADIALGQTFEPEGDPSWKLSAAHGIGEPWMSLGPSDTVSIDSGNGSQENYNILWLTRNVIPGYAHVESSGMSYSEATPNAADWLIQKDANARKGGRRYFGIDTGTNLVKCEQGGVYALTVTGFVSAAARAGTIASGVEEQELQIDWRGSFKDSYVNTTPFKLRLSMFVNDFTIGSSTDPYSPLGMDLFPTTVPADFGTTGVPAVGVNPSVDDVFVDVHTAFSDLISNIDDANITVMNDLATYLNSHAVLPVKHEKSLGNRAVSFKIITPLGAGEEIGLSITNSSYDGSSSYTYPALQVSLQLDIQRVGAS